MKISLSSLSQDVISIPSDFANLVELTKDYLTYDFEYHINQTEAIAFRGFLVRIRIFKQRAIRPLLGVSQSVNNAQILNTIRIGQSQAKSTISANNELVIADAYDDITSKFNNQEIEERVRALGKNRPFTSNTIQKNIRVKTVSDVIALGKHNETLIGHREGYKEVEDDFDIQQAMLDELLYHNSDPTQNLNKALTESFVSVFDASHGIEKATTELPRKTSRIIWSNFLAAKKNPIKKIGDLSRDELVTVVIDDTTDVVKCKKRVKLERNKLSNVSEFFVRFDVIANSGFVISTQTINVKFADDVMSESVPRTQPIVGKVTFPAIGRCYLDVKQTDKNATQVRVFRKVIRTHDDFLNEYYEFVDDFPIKHSDGFKKIPVVAQGITPTIFRVISMSESGELSPEFTNVVVQATHIPNKQQQTSCKRQTFHVLLASIVDGGVSIEARNISPGPVSVRFLRRNKTLRENNFSTILGHESFISLEKQSIPTILDNDVKKFHVYEYALEFIYPYGECIKTGSVIIEYVPLTINVVFTEITEFSKQSSDDFADVKFTLNSTFNKTLVDQVNDLLTKNDKTSFFENELKDSKAQLNNLLAYRIIRVNLTTGLREDLGTITDSIFVDSKISPIKSATPLNPKHSYRYEISTLSRNAQSLFVGKFTEVSVDKKTFNVHKWKFEHPLAKIFGNLPTQSSLKLSHAKDDFLFGNLGDLVIQEVSFNKDNVFIDSVISERVDTDTMLIKWTVTGNYRLIDHFEIYREVTNARSYIGKCHACFDSGEFFYFHRLNHDDEGFITYVIRPVFNNYEIGVENAAAPIKVDF